MQVVYKLGNKKLSHEEFVAAGQRDGIREIIESRSFPGLHTDDEFMARRGTLRDQLGEQVDDVVNAAKRHGYTPSMNDVYLPAAARFVGDPEAFVKHDSARGELKRTFEKRGWACEGSVKVKGRQSEPKEVSLADDIVDREVKTRIALGEVKGKTSVAEMRHEVIEKHGG